MSSIGHGAENLDDIIAENYKRRSLTHLKRS